LPRSLRRRCGRLIQLEAWSRGCWRKSSAWLSAWPRKMAGVPCIGSA